MKNLPANEGDVRDMGLIPGSRRFPGEGNGSPLQYSCLQNLMDRGAWRSTVHGVTKSQMPLKRLSTDTKIDGEYLFSLLSPRELKNYKSSSLDSLFSSATRVLGHWEALFFSRL